MKKITLISLLLILCSCTTHIEFDIDWIYLAKCFGFTLLGAFIAIVILLIIFNDIRIF